MPNLRSWPKHGDQTKPTKKETGSLQDDHTPQKFSTYFEPYPFTYQTKCRVSFENFYGITREQNVNNLT